jgi:ATP-binding cassette subfamily C (CFTR/MRP) protein 1
MLMLSILGETNISSGELTYNGKLGYVNMKKPLWLAGKSLQENIVLDNCVSDEKRYKRLLNVVQLDWKKFPGEDRNIVQPGGQNYSVADKRKILLARALYQNCDIYLLDGLFEGMDSTEKKDFFTRIILRELRNCTVVFTECQRSLARLADRIVVLEQGCIGEHGTIDELDSREDTLFSQIVNQDNVMGTDTSVNGISKLMETVNDGGEPKKTQLSGVSNLTESIRTKDTDMLKYDAANAHIEEEDTIKTINLWDIGKRYMFLRGPEKCAREITIIVASVSAGLLSDIWLGVWSGNAIGTGLGFYLFVYTVLSVFHAASVVYRNLVVRFGLIENGDIIHFKMLDNILRSTCSWFSHNPTGRIINRFTVDQNTVDVVLSMALINSIEFVICVLAGAFIFNLFYMGF